MCSCLVESLTSYLGGSVNENCSFGQWQNTRVRRAANVTREQMSFSRATGKQHPFFFIKGAWHH